MVISAFSSSLPMLVLAAGAAFAIGGLTRNAILVFVLPLAILLFGAFFLWDWSPSWLSLGWNRALQFVDLTGLRWMNETWLTVDKGVDFYNRRPVGLDALIVTQRLLCVALGLGAMALLHARFAATVRGARRVKGGLGTPAGVVTAAAARIETAPIAALAMRSGVPGFVAGALAVARTEWRELLKHPELYLFTPMILLQVLGDLVSVGAFDTQLLNTPGGLAVRNMNTLTLLICMMILFYTTESLQRERSSGLGPILGRRVRRGVRSN